MEEDKNLSQKISVYSPGKVVFGNGSLNQFIDDFSGSGFIKLFVLAIPELKPLIEEKFKPVLKKGIDFKISCDIQKEPSFADFFKILSEAQKYGSDSIAGIGGGSVMDTAKLLAAWVDKGVERKRELADNSKLSRNVYLACIPTTSGTGSEVSPNAIFFDEEKGKVGIIHPALVPDGAYIDPELTESLPPGLTAATGLDALTHCIEAYVNRFAHPVTDLLALEGIRLLGKNLRLAFFDGKNNYARSKVALGSLYGGMCLGPVNTGAVHALAYPLGSKYKIAHGVSNALMLPHVMKFNLESAPGKYARVALAMGAETQNSDIETAQAGIEIIKTMMADFNLPSKLSELQIKEGEIESLAHSALQVQRLLKNNVREVSLMNAIYLYRKAF